MTREEKTAVIEELREKFSTSPNFYVCDASGMTVEQTNNFRRLAFERGLEYRVFKNTLIKKALETSGVDYTEFNTGVLKGMSGVLFAADNMKAPAKLLKDFYRQSNAKLPALKGASIDASFYIGADQLDALTALKSRQELIGEVIGLLQSPAKNVISALKGQGGKIAGIVKTLSERQAA
jgi:large subunit ribosomal protein L10